MTEAALALSEQKVCSLGEILSAAKEEQARLVEKHAKEFQQHKKVDIWEDLKSQGVYIIKQDIWHHLKQMSLLETSPMLVGKGYEAAPRFGSNQDGHWKKEEGLTMLLCFCRILLIVRQSFYRNFSQPMRKISSSKMR